MGVWEQAVAWDALKNGESIPIEAKRKTHPKRNWQPPKSPKPQKGKPKGDGQ